MSEDHIIKKFNKFGKLSKSFGNEKAIPKLDLSETYLRSVQKEVKYRRKTSLLDRSLMKYPTALPLLIAATGFVIFNANSIGHMFLLRPVKLE